MYSVPIKQRWFFEYLNKKQFLNFIFYIEV